MDGNNIPIGTSAVILTLGYLNLALSIQEFINRKNEPIWKKLWTYIKVDVEDLCRILLIGWAVFPNIATAKNLAILWTIILTEFLHRRLKSKIPYLKGTTEDLCRVFLMLMTLYPNISSLYDVWLVWIILLMEIVYRNMKFQISYVKEFSLNIFSALPGRKYLFPRDFKDGTAKEDIMTELQCPLCTNLLASPITMCANGHNICNKCKPKLQKCPVCRGILLDLRNISLEKVAESLREKT